MKKLLLLAALALVVASPALAADQVQMAPSDDAVLTAPVQSNDAPACSATQAPETDAAPLLFETPTAEPEACYPAECSCCYPCCRNKCWVC